MSSVGPRQVREFRAWLSGDDGNGGDPGSAARRSGGVATVVASVITFAITQGANSFQEHGKQEAYEIAMQQLGACTERIVMLAQIAKPGGLE